MMTVNSTAPVWDGNHKGDVGNGCAARAKCCAAPVWDANLKGPGLLVSAFGGLNAVRLPFGMETTPVIPLAQFSVRLNAVGLPSGMETRLGVLGPPSHALRRLNGLPLPSGMETSTVRPGQRGFESV